ncbi:MAG: c-type cytochrome [Vicinamibacterales bacterium]
MSTRLLTHSAFALYLAVAGAAVLSAAQAPEGRTVWNGVYTTEQAGRGRDQFLAHCAECHMTDLSGGEGPALVGDRFWTTWQETSVAALFDRISKNMPFDDDGKLAGSLPRQSYVDIVAYILSSNGFPAGTAELTDTSGEGVAIVRREGPTELANGTLAKVVGCLVREGNTFRVTQATRPVRDPGRSNAAADREVALGDRTFELKFLLVPPTRNVGHRVTVTGTLMGEGGADGINTTLVTSVANTCQ